MHNQETASVGDSMPAKPKKSVAVTVIGVITILWGGAHAVVGSCLILAGDQLNRNLRPGDPAGGVAPLLWLTAALMTLVGVAFLLDGVPLLLAGLGVLFRKKWGRVLAIIMAIPAILMGLLSLSAYKSDGAVSLAVLGAAEIIYGICTLIILIKNGVEGL